MKAVLRMSNAWRRFLFVFRTGCNHHLHTVIFHLADSARPLAARRGQAAAGTF
jgi:hypothetical protein